MIKNNVNLKNDHINRDDSMENAQDIINENNINIDGNELLSSVLSSFKETDAIVIMENKKYKGMLLKRCLIEPKLSLETKVHTLVTHTPKLMRTTPLEEVAQLMVENDIYHLPVIENEIVIGIVTADDVLKHFIGQTTGSQPINSIMQTQQHLSIDPNITLGKVITMFQKHNISYLPILDHTKIIGTISRNDIIERMMHPEVKLEGWAGYGAYSTQKNKKFDLPVTSIMQENPRMFSSNATIHELHTYMHKNNLDGALIGTENHFEGIITYKELLKPFVTVSKPETFAIQFHPNVNKINGFNKEETISFLRDALLHQYEKFLETGYIHVSLQQHKENRKGIHRFICEMKLSSQHGVFYASQEGFGAFQAIKNSAEAIEHQIHKEKRDKKADYFLGK